MSSFPLTNSYFFRWLKPATSYNLLCHSVSTQALWWLMTWVVPRFTFSDLYYHTLPGILSGILCDIYNDIYIYLVTLSVIQSDRDCYCWFSIQLVIHSDILSDISFDMLSDKKLDLTVYPDFYLSFYLAFYLAFYLEFDLALYLAFCLTDIYIYVCIYIYMYVYIYVYIYILRFYLPYILSFSVTCYLKFLRGSRFWAFDLAALSGILSYSLSDIWGSGISGIYPLVMTNSSPWKDPPIFKNGKPSISMGHRKTMANCECHNQRVVLGSGKSQRAGSPVSGCPGCLVKIYREGFIWRRDRMSSWTSIFL